MSLRITNKLLPEELITSIMRFCLASSSVLLTSCTMPKIPFMGVRISWLILAKNSDLIRDVSSAAFFASTRRSFSTLNLFAAWAKNPISSSRLISAMFAEKSPFRNDLKLTVSLLIALII